MDETHNTAMRRVPPNAAHLWDFLRLLYVQVVCDFRWHVSKALRVCCVFAVYPLGTHTSYLRSEHVMHRDKLLKVVRSNRGKILSFTVLE